VSELPSPPWAGRALSVTVTSFDKPELESLLPFAGTGQEMVGALSAAGYSVSSQTGLTGQEIGERVEEFLTVPAPGPLIVHVLSHGTLSPTGGLYVIGKDGERHPRASVDNWMRLVEDYADRPYTLFLLDLCHAGAAARPSWLRDQVDADDHKAWVIAAAGAYQQAFDARFTRAAATVIRRINDGDLDFYQGYEYVQFPVIAQSVRAAVTELTAPGDYAQRPIATPCDPTRDISGLPFFRNSRYTPDPAARIHAALGSAMGSYVDEVLDFPHWRDRSLGYGPLHEEIAGDGHVSVGCFSGRSAQVRRLAAWLDFPDPAAPALHVVTGRPGSGKSALLGVLVCAAHPLLSDRTRALWASIREAAPSVNRYLAAVHARQRGLTELLESLWGQLLPGARAAPGRGIREFLDALAAVPEQPVVVVDALDESDEPRAVMNDLLVPLLEERRPDGRSLARLLIGMRQVDYLNWLFIRAQAQVSVTDLDAADSDQVRADLQLYVHDLLRHCEPYNDRSYAAPRGRFAAAVASSLTADGGITRPGGFLAAALYTYHLVKSQSPLQDPEQAARFGSLVPSAMQEVLELDLLTRSGESPWLRPVLVAVAHARGQGMPATLISRLAGLWAPGLDPGSLRVRDVLNEARSYLRQGPDTNDRTVYRLFHQGLADHLRDHPFSRDSGPPPQEQARLLTRLLGEAVNWADAEPYLLRHGIQHALAAGRQQELIESPAFLVHADPQTLFPALDTLDASPVGPGSPAAPSRVARAVYRTSFTAHRGASPARRRRLLAVDAARWGEPALSHLLENVPLADQPASEWRAAWATGSLLHPAQRGLLTGPGQARQLASCMRLDNRQVAVIEDPAGRLGLWDLADNRFLAASGFGVPGQMTAAACTVLPGGPVVVAGGDDGAVRMWRLATGEPLGRPIPGEASIATVACVVVRGRPVALVARDDTSVETIDLMSREPLAAPARLRQVVTAITVSETRDQVTVVACLRDGGSVIWDIADPAAARPLSTTVAVASAASLHVGQRPTLVTGGWDGKLRVWDLSDRRQLGEPAAGLSSPVEAMALLDIDGRPTIISGGAGDPALHLWDVKTRRLVGDPLTGHMAGIRRVLATSPPGPPTAVSIDHDGEVRVWDPTEWRGLGTSHRVCHTRPIKGIWPIEAGERPLVCVHDGTGLTTWDLATGRHAQVTAPAPGVATALSVAQSNGAAYAIDADDGGAIRRWTISAEPGPRPPEAVLTRPGLRAAAIAEADGTLFVVAGDEAGRLALRPLRPRAAEVRVDAHDGPVTSVAAGRLRGLPVAVSGGVDGMVRAWDLHGRELHHKPLRGHGAEVSHIAYAELDEEPLAVSADRFGVLRLWNLAARQPLDAVVGTHRAMVTALALVLDRGRRPVAASGDANGGIRLWSLRNLALDDELSVPGPVSSLAFDAAGRLAVSFGVDLVVYGPRFRRGPRVPAG
jgi:WD40 repeat protein